MSNVESWRVHTIYTKNLSTDSDGTIYTGKVDTSSVQSSRSVVSDSLRPHEPQHARPPCPSPTAGVHPNPCPLSQWCRPTVSSSVVPFFSCPQSFPASRSFPMSQFFASGSLSIGASVLELQVYLRHSVSNEYSGLISFRFDGLIFWQFQGLSRVFSSTIIQKHQFLGTKSSLWSNSHICIRLLEKS